jgi:acetyl esterase/lipase
MNINPYLDPELATALAAQPADLPPADWHDLPRMRAEFDRMAEAGLAATPESPDVAKQDYLAPGPAAAPDVPVRVYRPANRQGVAPCLFWIHGGGYMVGHIPADERYCEKMALAVDCMVVSVEYRLAPDCPFPGPLEDCYAALKWTFAHAGELDIDPARIAIGGGSAGGGLAAGLALLARDRGEVRPIFQYLIFPMIDDRNTTPSSYAITDARCWNREANLIGWRSYLGCEPGGPDVSPYAAAARAEDLSNLPPAYLAVGSLDLFLDENIEYAQRLLQAGVTCELHVYPGVIHGWEGIVPQAAVTRRFIEERENALRRALQGGR